MRSDRPPPAESDRTNRARIRDAAIARFGADGVKGTSLKAIAADAGVSPALVLHHFGSKDGLREACDQHVASIIRESKTKAAAKGSQLDPFAALREGAESLPLLRYLARNLVDGSPAVARLVDELAEDAVAYGELSVKAGLMKPSDQPRERMIVLTLWSLGALVLHEHMERLLGADFTSGASLIKYMRPASEILGEGVLTETLHQQLKAAFANPAATDATEGGSSLERTEQEEQTEEPK